jgi:hypothetical protein
MPVAAVIAVIVIAWSVPTGADIRRPSPIAGAPGVTAAIPAVIAVDPAVSITRRRICGSRIADHRGRRRSIITHRTAKADSNENAWAGE